VAEALQSIESGIQGSANQAQVIVVDDDELFRESLERNLLDAGFSVRNFGDGASALDYLRSGAQTDLILLDWKMPELNGIEVLRQMRSEGIATPVIFLTVLSDQIYEESALLHGAVDFVEKSRSFSILLKRIELITHGARGAGGAEDDGGKAAVMIGQLELRRETSRAFWGGNKVDLTLNEFKMVDYMARRAGKDVRYRELYDLIHGKGFVAGAGDEGYRANVRTFIKRIRQKFRDIDSDFEQIENYPGFGYRWRPADQVAS
jgi:two-component system response regulator ChvI